MRFIWLLALAIVNFVIAFLTDLGMDTVLSGTVGIPGQIGLAFGSFLLGAFIWAGTYCYDSFVGEDRESNGPFGVYWKILLTSGLPIIGGYLYGVKLPDGYPTGGDHLVIFMVILFFTIGLGIVGNLIGAIRNTH